MVLFRCGKRSPPAENVKPTINKQRASFLFGVSLLPLDNFETAAQVARSSCAHTTALSPASWRLPGVGLHRRRRSGNPKVPGVVVGLTAEITDPLSGLSRRCLTHHIAQSTFTILNKERQIIFCSGGSDPSNHYINIKTTLWVVIWRDSTWFILARSCWRKYIFPSFPFTQFFFVRTWVWRCIICAPPTHTHTLSLPVLTRVCKTVLEKICQGDQSVSCTLSSCCLQCKTKDTWISFFTIPRSKGFSRSKATEWTVASRILSSRQHDCFFP